MPVTKTATRALRHSKRRQKINSKTKRLYKEAIKKVRRETKGKNLKEAKKALPEVYRQLDLATKKNVIHKNKASRLKSRLARLISSK